MNMGNWSPQEMEQLERDIREHADYGYLMMREARNLMDVSISVLQAAKNPHANGDAYKAVVAAGKVSMMVLEAMLGTDADAEDCELRWRERHISERIREAEQDRRFMEAVTARRALEESAS